MNPEMAMVMKRNEEREALRSVIQQWNANRLDLFELSEPNENLEFHGVMRFYFQDSGQKVATKCIRVASDATAQDVVETLIEKFRPDMRMLSLPEYALFEIHENGEERKLAMDEKPLLVQLNWHKDDREGRFLLRRLDDKTKMPSNTFQQDGSSFRRKLSKREKKQLKKEKLNRLKSSGANNENDARVAEKLYSELPETSFTRSISNPEAVMRRRRQQQLERKLQQFRSKDGGPDTGGTLKIYGESLCRDVPYKTLLLSIRDTAQQVVKEMLVKYGLEKEDPHNYCLVQANVCNEYSKENNHQNNITNNNDIALNSQEYILDDDECPLAILMTHTQSQGSIMFHVRRRPADYHPRKRKKKPQHKWNQHQSPSNELLEYRYEDGLDRLPLFLELNPDGSEICGGAAKRHRLHPNVTEVGCERNSSPTQSQYLQLFGPNILPRHCVIANTEGIVTVTPCSRESETYVNGQRIYETTILRNGSIVKFGRIHCFRFLDPYFEERIRQRQDSVRNVHEYNTYDPRQSTREDSSVQNTTSVEKRISSLTQMTDSQISHNFETTFDVEGNIETRSTSSQGNKEDSRSQRSIGSGSKDGNRIPSSAYHRQGTDQILPAVLEIKEETEETLLNEIITSLDPNVPTFKLAPAYCLYLLARYRASTHYRPELTPTERAHRLTLMLARVANIIQKVIQERYCDIKSLALWLANSSELLFFLQFDRHLFAFSKDARRMLAESVQISFRHLVGCVQSELSAVMPHFFADKDDTSHDSDESPTVLGVLGSAMNLLRRYRVNVALTVQLFSHLFHFINVWAFNRLIAPNTNYCSRVWGLRLKARLAQIEAWAERQGLEISTDTHLAKIVQAAHLLQAPKYNADDLPSLSSSCFLLNSLQLRALLLKYQPASDEPSLPRDQVENVVKVAENLADELARSDGREVKLEEDPEFALEFVLPIDSYSCEVVRGIPPGLVEFVAPLQTMGLCRLSTQPTSNGLWTVYMELPSVKGAMMRSSSAMSNRSVGYLPGPQEPEIQIIKLHKSNNGMGLSIVAAKGAGQDKLGIYIKSVVKGGAADADGRLLAGDQLLKVDGQSLVGITQEKAAEYLVRTGPIVTLEVAKQGAIYHGLATLLSQPSPVMAREKSRPRSDLCAEPLRETLPYSFSMINLNQNAYTDCDIRWHDKSGVTSGNYPCCDVGGGSVGKHLKLPRNKSNFQPRYGNYLHPDYALLYPNNACYEEPYEEETISETKEDERLSTANPVRGILTNANTDFFNRISSSTTRPPYPLASSHSSKLCLCEDVLQCRRAIKEPSSQLSKWHVKGAQSSQETNGKMAGITKQIVFDVAPCHLSVQSENDANAFSVVQPAANQINTTEKSVMTDETYFLKTETDVMKPTYNFRNSCPLIPPFGQLCECEKKIFNTASGIDQAVVGRVLYQNGTDSKARNQNESSSVPQFVEKESKIAFDERYYESGNQQALTSTALIPIWTSKNKSLEEVNVTVNELRTLSPTRRSNSDANLYTKSTMIAECTKCGNRFDVRGGAYFSGAIHENVGSSSTSSSLSETWSSSGDTRNQSERFATDKNRKLTECERESILKQLEEVISGDFFTKMAFPCKSNSSLSYIPASMLHLNLDALKDSDASSVSECGSVDASSPCYRLGRVAELTKHFSKLGDSGIIKPGAKTKSAPNITKERRHISDTIVVKEQRCASMEELKPHTKDSEVRTREVKSRNKNYDSEAANVEERKNDTEDYELDATTRSLLYSAKDEPKSSSQYSRADTVECSRRRQSFARQNTVFCKMKSVDELDLKKRDHCRLYKYASLSDFRSRDGEFVLVNEKKRIVSFDNLDLTRKEKKLVEQRLSPAEKKFYLESFLRKSQLPEQNLKVNYDKMTTAIRDYLANKELLLKRMKSNSVDNIGIRNQAFSRPSTTSPNFTSMYEVEDDHKQETATFKSGMSVDVALSRRKECSSADEFIFKDNIRRVHKGCSYFKNRRFRKCGKLSTRRSVLIFPGERLINLQLDDDTKKCRPFQSRCQSLDTGIDNTVGAEDAEPSRGRRMSERDLPSRLLNEPPNQTMQLPAQTPIHSSKSVPSLNSPCGTEGQIVSPIVSRSSHEVFNATFNSTPTSSTMHPQHPTLRSRSSQNLNDSRSMSNYPQNMSNTLPSRQPSNPNLLQNSASPHYAQHYNQVSQQQQQQQHPMYHQHVQQQQMLLHQQQQQLYHQQQQQPPQQHYQYSQHNLSADTGERFYQNLNVYRNQEMQSDVIHENVVNTMVKGKILSSPQERNVSHFQRSFRGSQTSLQQPSQSKQSVEMLPSYMRDRPSSAYMQKENFSPSAVQGMSARSQSTRDVMRQEAKLHEMTEEVRRREIRSNLSQQHYPVNPSRILSPTENLVEPNVLSHHNRGNAAGVMYGDEQTSRPPYLNHKNGVLRPGMEEIGYRESPPPPPPPPTSTHPLYQPNISQRSPDNRYMASVGEPPKGGYYPSSPITSSSKHYQLQGTNPWEREEREKEAERRREAVKEWRDQQISELLSLGPNRNPSQEEQLRALKLEKEFERRAQEEDEDDDEDHETAERIQDVMRVAREQDDIRNGPKNNSYVPQTSPNRWANSHAQINGNVPRFHGNQNIAEEKERLRRLKDMKIKQVEQGSLKEEEQNFGINGHVAAPTKMLHRPTHLRLDNLMSNVSDQSTLTNNSFNNVEYTIPIAAPQQRLDNLLEHNSAPPPPERGSSFAIMSQAFRSPVTTTSLGNSSKNEILQSSCTITPKKVSFQENSSEIISNSTPVEKVLEDPNRFINEAESMLASPKSPDTQFLNSTPGVIGTQEVYRDPRQKRLAEQQHQKLLNNKIVPVPEKLTFKEKMKMFAMETGEEGTPKDKVKISRAQRDIDNLNSPSTPGNATKNSNAENSENKVN